MNKEFITHNQALALKELGFDEPCLAYYQKSAVIGDDTILPIQIRNKASNFNDNEYSKMGVPFCSAPLYQQAFRWFREKYNIQGYIYSSTVRGNAEKTKQFTGYIWNINGIDMPFLSTDARDELHDTYEQAEHACLDKLIEISKTK